MVAALNIEKDHLFVGTLPNGCASNYTLASRLGHIIQKAEQLYGPRDQTYTILGVEIGGDIPMVWYPDNCRHVIVRITESSATNVMRAAYQMAHEAIHLLSPTGKKGTTVLEEGLATHFSARYMREHLNSRNWHATEASYTHACQLIEELLTLDSEAIRLLRQVKPSMAETTADDLVSVLPSISTELANSLTMQFQR